MATKVLQVELSDHDAQFPVEEGYDDYHVLVKAGKKPIGWISFSRSNLEENAAGGLTEIITRQLGHSLIDETLGKYFYSPETVPTEGISVVVCTRDRTTQLANCLQTLLALNYTDYEIIVVDNAPANDDTRQLVAGMRVRYVLEERPGLNWARNRGIAEARYDIVAFTDDDVLVDENWLQAIAHSFCSKQVMGVSGFVAPAELETAAQRLFELDYGGMGHGFDRRILRRDNSDEIQLLWASNFGIGANMAFRRAVFEDIGTFDIALDVGTPSHGGGDVELFHRLVARGHQFVYDPAIMVWHYHRKDFAGLRRQVFNNGRSFGCFLITCFVGKTIKRKSIIRFLLVNWFYKWNLKNLLRSKKIPKSLSLVELFGMVTSPVAYIKSQKYAKRITALYAPGTSSSDLPAISKIHHAIK